MDETASTKRARDLLQKQSEQIFQLEQKVEGIHATTPSASQGSQHLVEENRRLRDEVFEENRRLRDEVFKQARQLESLDQTIEQLQKQNALLNSEMSILLRTRTSKEGEGAASLTNFRRSRRSTWTSPCR